MTGGDVLPEEAFAARARAIEWILLDVDGVLTDGRLIFGPAGEQWKVFDVRDGAGIKIAQRSGIKVGILSGRKNDALRVRAEELGLDAVLMGRPEKRAAFADFLSQVETSPDKVAYIGDDLLDLPVIVRCGLSFAPADAACDVRERVHRVLQHRGGRGAVRELCELLVRARGGWEPLVASLSSTSG